MFGLAVSASWSRSVTSAVAEFGLASVLYHCLHLLLHVPEIELIFLDASAHGLEGYALFCIISLNSIFSSLMHCQYFIPFFMPRIFLPSPFASLITFVFEYLNNTYQFLDQSSNYMYTGGEGLESL